ncbi:hypothetical protein KIN20_017945 [Parelaphostrongylus tenuis]|uniref:Uncharacterized protein n=1 Tax=Parelaphostrongylus tenuis TaxID=148309 RepID=A0AAD5MIQ1_PARTN|nr:hypothetical protein KIN20_017945 [Parelaphostrongylus tenuis]
MLYNRSESHQCHVIRTTYVVEQKKRPDPGMVLDGPQCGDDKRGASAEFFQYYPFNGFFGAFRYFLSGIRSGWYVLLVQRRRNLPGEKYLNAMWGDGVLNYSVNERPPSFIPPAIPLVSMNTSSPHARSSDQLLAHVPVPSSCSNPKVVSNLLIPALFLLILRSMDIPSPPPDDPDDESSFMRKHTIRPVQPPRYLHRNRFRPVMYRCAEPRLEVKLSFPFAVRLRENLNRDNDKERKEMIPSLTSSHFHEVTSVSFGIVSLKQHALSTN